MSFPSPALIPVNGIELEVFSAGSGRPVVLCHGWPEHAYSWRHQIEPLAAAGYHVIVPNQRGYGHSTAPKEVTDYDIEHLCGDLVGLLDHYGYDKAAFVGHDWGAIVVWAMSVLHPDRVEAVINLSVPYLQRYPMDWVSLWEKALGGDFYIVHFNRQPGVADAAFGRHTRQFLRNLYRTNQWRHPAPQLDPGMPMISIANRTDMPGDALMSDADLDVFVKGFERNTFTPGINWYRNFARNWEILGRVPEKVTQPALMIYGEYDMVRKSDTLGDVVGNLETVTLACGHWIQQERPAETNAAMLEWLGRHYPAA